MVFFFKLLFIFVQSNPGISGTRSPFSHSQKRRSAPLKVVALGTNAARTGERNGSVVMENTVKEAVELKSTVHGGVKDVYGEDTASEDQLVTPWSVSVARCEQRVICFTNNIVIGNIVIYSYVLFLRSISMTSMLFCLFCGSRIIYFILSG